MVPRFKKGRSIIFHKVNISGPRGLVVLVLVVVYCGSRVVLVLLVIVGVVVVAKVLVSRSSSSSSISSTTSSSSICSSLRCSFYSAFTSALNTFVFYEYDFPVSSKVLFSACGQMFILLGIYKYFTYFILLDIYEYFGIYEYFKYFRFFYEYDILSFFYNSGFFFYENSGFFFLRNEYDFSSFRQSLVFCLRDAAQGQVPVPGSGITGVSEPSESLSMLRCS